MARRGLPAHKKLCADVIRNDFDLTKNKFSYTPLKELETKVPEFLEVQTMPHLRAGGCSLAGRTPVQEDGVSYAVREYAVKGSCNVIEPPGMNYVPLSEYGISGERASKHCSAAESVKVSIEFQSAC